MKRRMLSLLLVFIMVLGMLPVTAFAEDSATEETASVDIYLAISKDAGYFECPEGAIPYLQPLTVSYFDLALYGLEQYYFSSEEYGSDGGDHSSDLTPGTAEFAKNKVTMMHVLIYATEVFYCGIDASEAGKGYLYNEGLIGSDVLTYSGEAGSSFMEQFWGDSCNLNYYVNYEYPLASNGWGATADQILLEDGDVACVGHFTGWNFYSDSGKGFHYMTAGEDKVTTTAKQGEEVTFTLYRAGASMAGDYTTTQYLVDACLDAYICNVNEISSADVSEWTPIGTTDGSGNLTLDTTDLEPGTYLVAVPGQYGMDNAPDEIVSTPGGILLTVTEGDAPSEEDVTYGDVNGDGEVTNIDASMVYSAYNGKIQLTQAQQAAADVNGDGSVDNIDAAMIYSYYNGKITAFPNA